MGHFINFVHLTSSFSYAAVSNAKVCEMLRQMLRFVKMMAIFEIINATDSLIQNIIRIVPLFSL